MCAPCKHYLAKIMGFASYYNFFYTPCTNEYVLRYRSMKARAQAWRGQAFSNFTFFFQISWNLVGYKDFNEL